MGMLLRGLNRVRYPGGECSRKLFLPMVGRTECRVCHIIERLGAVGILHIIMHVISDSLTDAYGSDLGENHSLAMHAEEAWMVLGPR